MKSSTYDYRTLRIKQCEALAMSNQFRLSAGMLDGPAAELFTATAEALCRAWATGWRRPDGSLAEEFVIHMWTTKQLVAGLMNGQLLMGLDAKFPDDIDAYLSENESILDEAS